MRAARVVKALAKAVVAGVVVKEEVVTEMVARAAVGVMEVVMAREGAAREAVAGMLVKEEEVVVEARAAGWGTAVNVRVAVAMAVATEVDAVAGNVMAAVVAAATRAAAGRMAAAMAAEVDVSAILAVSGSSTIFQRRQ